MANYDRMYGALELDKLRVGAAILIHLRHPITPDTLMCGIDPKTVFPIGAVAPNDPSLHPNCVSAWVAARKVAQPADKGLG